MKRIVWTTEKVEEVREQILNGFIPPRVMNPFYENDTGLRKEGLVFKMTQDEVNEYIKCKMDVHYFAENYCWIKGEKGDPVKIVLRDYQKEILDNFFNNRFNILMASRQTGKCFLSDTQLVIKEGDVISNIKPYELLLKLNNRNPFNWIKFTIYRIIDILK